MWFSSVRSRTFLSIAASSFTVIIAASACSSAGSSNPSDGSTGTVETISVQVPPVVDVAPIYLAQKQGLFAKQGLDVKLSIGQGGAAIAAALQSGSTDIGFVNYVSAIGGISNGLPLSLVADGDRGAPGSFVLVVTMDSPIKSPADLKGKKIGVISTGSVSDLTTDARLSEYGLSPSDVSYVNVPLPNLLSAVGHQVDAVLVNEPYVSLARAQGDRLVLDAYAGKLAGLAVAGYFSTNSWAGSHADALRRFAAVLAQASTQANNDQSAVRAILPDYAPIKADQASSLILPVYAASTDISKVQAVADLMSKYNFLKSPVDMSKHLAQ